MAYLEYKDLQIEIQADENILSCLRRYEQENHTDGLAGLIAAIAAPCGGHGTCGKCRIGVDPKAGELSPVTEEEAKFLTDIRETLPDGYIWRLACRCRVLAGRVRLWVATEELHMAGAQADSQQTQAGDVSPWFTWQPVTLRRPTLDEPLSVSENLYLSTGSPLSLTTRASNRLTRLMTAQMDSAPHGGDISLYLCQADTPEGNLPVVDADNDNKRPLYGAAIDLGTTTIAMSLWRDDGVKMAGTVMPNPTRIYGADVISRISYTMEHPDGTEKLMTILRNSVEETLEKLAAEAGLTLADISCRVLAGNAVMEHLYAGLDPAPIGKVPFYTQSRFGLPITTEPLCWLAPAAASYVGGDILMGAAWLLWADKTRADKTILFLDLGTNGELGVYRDGKFIFAATAAGPAFEGAHIELGMPAVPGAVRTIDLEDNTFVLETVGSVTPTGLCGSGILDGVWQMLTHGLMDEYGGLVDDRTEWSISLPEGLGVDEDGEKCVFAPGVYLTQGDVRQIQTAKSAIAAGVAILCQAAGITEDQIDEVCLAGSFGRALRSDAAAGIGLIPSLLHDRVTAVGNTSEAGCAAFWLHRSFRDILEDVRQKSVYIELSVQPDFGDLYMDNMLFS